MKLFRIAMGLAACATIASLSVPAQAVPMLQLSDGVNTVTVTDQLAGDSNPSADTVTYIGSIGTWSINVSTGISSRDPQILLDLNSVNGSISSSNAGTLTILFTDTDFSLANSQWAALSVGGTASGPVAFSAYYDPSNTAFNTTGTAVQIGSTMAGNTSPFAYTTNGLLPADGAFSLTQKAVITHTSGGLTSFDFQTKVPEPSGLALFGAGLLAVGIVRRRRLVAPRA